MADDTSADQAANRPNSPVIQLYEPIPSDAPGGSCFWNGAEWPQGYVACLDWRKKICENGVWRDLASPCFSEDVLSHEQIIDRQETVHGRMSIFEQMADLVAKSRAAGREPKGWRIRADLIADVEAEADAAGEIDGNTIFGAAYEALSDEEPFERQLFYEDRPAP